ncbi:glycosyltransferase [Amphibacillus cookii]|uniref:glycosyltransferase n=1 Tax=Amphibacillus cookii TaxID=767787 RepID=UPI001EF8A400|nr:glycosyltransferase [Amphibacillus cookii]MBM7539779.1 glycosyltransferase involved in cell wall biosynthesis [Amphibacillus cookii]
MDQKYSVLMSLYYKEKSEYLTKSIDSMLEQTVKPDEIIIVKDGELTQELEDILSIYHRKFSSLIKLVPLETNVGLGKALDIGLNYCSNQLVARMDTDDISLPERCEKQLKMFQENSELSIVGAMIDEFYEKPSNVVSSRVVPTSHKDIVAFIKRRSPFNHPTVMFKKDAVISSGGYGNLRRKQDLDLFSRMINKGHKAANIDESLLLFRSNEDNFKRRKSWSYCKSYIDVQYTIWRRGHCSLIDLMVVTSGQLFMFVAPMWMLKYFSSKYLRQQK